MSNSIRRLGGLVMRQTAAFRLIERGIPGSFRYYIEARDQHSSPRVLRVSRDDAHELTERISLREFDGACVMSGCGVFQKKMPHNKRPVYV